MGLLSWIFGKVFGLDDIRFEVTEDDVKVDSYWSQDIANRRRALRHISEDVNVLFYLNEIESQPEGALIDTLHANFYGNFQACEAHHGYIQWLFPIFESAGMNSHSELLTKNGAKQIRESPAARMHSVIPENKI